MANQPYTRKHFQTDGEPPTYKETGITGASEHSVLYNEVSNSFWALLDWLISIWRFGFGRQKPSTTVSGNQAVSGNTRDQNGSFPVGNTPRKRARKKVKPNSSNSSTNAKSSPQTQITKDDKPKHDQKPSTTVSGNQAVSGNTRDQNGSFPVGNSSNSSTNVKSSRPPQTQITKDDKPKDVQKPSITVSDNQVSRNTGDDNGRFIVGNAPGKHARKEDKASSSNSSTSARSSRPSQTQISEDDKPEDDRKPCIVVSGNQINDNIGHRNGMFSVGKATGEHAQKKDKASSSNYSISARSSRPCQTQVSEDDKPEDDRKPCIIVSETGITGASEHAVLYNEVSNSFWALLGWVISIWRFVFGRQKPGNRACGNTGVYNGMLLVGNSTQDHARKTDKASSSNSSTSAKSSPPSQTQISEDDKPEDDRKPCIYVSCNQINNNNGFANGIFSVGNK